MGVKMLDPAGRQPQKPAPAQTWGGAVRDAILNTLAHPANEVMLNPWMAAGGAARIAKPMAPPKSPSFEQLRATLGKSLSFDERAILEDDLYAALRPESDVSKIDMFTLQGLLERAEEQAGRGSWQMKKVLDAMTARDEADAAAYGVANIDFLGHKHELTKALRWKK